MGLLVVPELPCSGFCVPVVQQHHGGSQFLVRESLRTSHPMNTWVWEQQSESSPALQSLYVNWTQFCYAVLQTTFVLCYVRQIFVTDRRHSEVVQMPSWKLELA